jgi:hypothetical protein
MPPPGLSRPYRLKGQGLWRRVAGQPGLAQERVDEVGARDGPEPGADDGDGYKLVEGDGGVAGKRRPRPSQPSSSDSAALALGACVADTVRACTASTPAYASGPASAPRTTQPPRTRTVARYGTGWTWFSAVSRC